MIPGFFLLHDIFPNDLGWYPPFLIFGGVIGVLSYPVGWLNRLRLSPEERQMVARPPLRRMAMIAAGYMLFATIVYVRSERPGSSGLFAWPVAFVALPFTWAFAFLGELPAVVLGSGVGAIGILTTVWRLERLLTGRWNEPAKSTAPPEPLVLEAELRSEQDACDKCRAAANEGSLGPPLTRVGHSSDGPKFLYRCKECHSYWLRELKSTTVISVVRARQLFPSAVN